ncbi:DUF3397 family protein [Metabacillus sp. 84]|uniref:DUF3397 family protein n=1 Tax=unclassified Metabacillus TaxID=2675274 RepID=UPI003CFB2B85
MAGVISVLLGAAAIVPVLCLVMLIAAFKTITGKGKKAVLAAADVSVMIFFFSVYIKVITIWRIEPSMYLFWTFIGWSFLFTLFFAFSGWKRPGRAFKKMWRLSFLVYFLASPLLFFYGAGLFAVREFY